MSWTQPDSYTRVRKSFEGETRTRQSEAGETDVNRIVARHQKTGVVTHLTNKPPMYGDLSLADDLKTALDLTFLAEEGFRSLPASVRKAADNDPRRMLEMLADPDLSADLVEAGLELEAGPEGRTATPVGLPFEPPSGGASAAASGAQAPQQPAPQQPASGAPEGGEQSST